MSGLDFATIVKVRPKHELLVENGHAFLGCCTIFISPSLAHETRHNMQRGQYLFATYFPEDVEAARTAARVEERKACIRARSFA